VTAQGAGEVALIAVAHGTALAAAAWILTATVLRRARPATIAALWTVVLVKFVVPFGPAMPYSISDVIEALRDGGAPAAAPVIHAGATTLAAPVAATTPPWIVVLLVAWLAGTAVVAARSIARARRAGRAARALPPANAALAAELAGLARRLRAPVPALRIAPAGAPPHVVGLIAPVIVLPAPLAAPDRATDRAAVLAHELAHLRRRDPWISVVQAATAALLWWWPVVPFVNRRIVAAREAACDAWAVARGPLPREQYARLLLSFARTPAPVAGAALAARAGGLRPRIEAVLARGAAARPGLGPLGLALVAFWIVVGLGGARSAAARNAGARECVFDPTVASTLLVAHPEADLDGDGTLSRAEACELQAELRKRYGDAPAVAPAAPEDPVSAEDEAVRAALAEPICCNCLPGEGMSSPAFTPVTREAACVVEGDSP
jgi:beta-lactamase regulating signal transducer with metallopeptidase domain